MYSKDNVVKYKPALWDGAHSKNDCYFCMNDVTGHNRKNRRRISYVYVSTVTKPIETNPIHEPLKTDDMQIVIEESSTDIVDSTDSN